MTDVGRRAGMADVHCRWPADSSLLAALCLLVSVAGACGMSDSIFSEGWASVEGQVLLSGEHAAGTSVVVENTSISTTTADDGTFSLPEVPAGFRTINVRNAAAGAGLRLRLLLAAGQSKNLGRLELKPAPSLPVSVKDPELGIAHVRVRLVELGLEAETDSAGTARFDAIVPDGCYKLEADGAWSGFRFGRVEACGDEPEAWGEGAKFTPESTGNLLFLQVRNALARLAEALEPLRACEAACQFPQWWLQAAPCPEPLGDLVTKNEKNARSLVTILQQLQRFRVTPWSGLSCPPDGTMTSECLQGRCWPAGMPGASARIVWSGLLVDTCQKVQQVVLLDGELVGDFLDCSGANGTDPGRGPWIIFSSAIPARATNAVVREEGETLTVYLEGRLQDGYSQDGRWVTVIELANLTGQPKSASVSFAWLRTD